MKYVIILILIIGIYYLIKKTNSNITNNDKNSPSKTSSENIIDKYEIDNTTLGQNLENSSNDDNLVDVDKDNYTKEYYEEQSVESLEYIAIELAKKNNWNEEAILVNSVIIEKDKKNSNAYTRLAKCYKDKDKSLAIKLYNEVLAFDHENKIAINNLERLSTHRNELEDRGIQFQQNAYIKNNTHKENMKLKFNNKTEGTIEKKINYEEIKDFVMRRNIQSLFHFTRYENIRSIMKHGLISVKELEKRNILISKNDYQRLDNQEESISLSIGFPNYKYFYKLRCENNEEKWAVIELEPSILWEKKCIFCATNAANSMMSYLSKSEREGLEALEKLFNDNQLRDKLNLPSYYTTDPQAEVLVMENIETSYIKTIYYNEYNLLNRVINDNYRNNKFQYSNEYFSYRSDYKYWTQN